MRTVSKGKALAGTSPVAVARGDEGAAQPMALLACEAIRRYRKRLRASERLARGGKDPEGVHDMRVATRGLRAALNVFVEAGVLKPGAVRRTGVRLRRLARALGRVRDLDVMVESAAEYVAANADASASLAGWMEHLVRRREKARARLLAELNGPRYWRLMRDLRRLSRRKVATIQGDTPPLVRHCAGSAIWRRYEAVLLAGEAAALEQQSPEALHELRIACKRLRYVVELFAEGFGPRAEPVQETLVRSQKALGAAHDTITRLAALRRYQRKRADAAGPRTYIEAETQRRDTQWTEVAPLRIELGGEPLRQALAAAIAAL